METPPVQTELAGPDLNVDTRTGAGRVFLWIEHVLLIVAAALTLVAVGKEIVSVYERGRVELADILLMFLYTEVIGMIAVFYTGKSSFFVFPIFIAIYCAGATHRASGKGYGARECRFRSRRYPAAIIRCIGNRPRPVQFTRCRDTEPALPSPAVL